MRAACSASRPSAGGAAVTPISRRSFAMVRTSIRDGTLVRRSGCSLRSAADMIGSAAFLAPEICTSPSSGLPPRMRSLSTGAPLLRRQRAHRQSVDFFAHALAQCGVHHLMPLHTILARKTRGYHYGLEVLAVAGHLHVIAGEVGRNAFLNAVWRNH